MLERSAVIGLWLERQGLAAPRARARTASGLTRAAFVALLERVGGLQIDTVNVLDRAHYLTLWSRFGSFDRDRLDRWVYRDRVAYEYWGHEASILPLSHLPFSRRRMKRFPDTWATKAWWPRFSTSEASKRRVLKRLRAEGPLESGDFERTPEADGHSRFYWGSSALPKEDKRSLKLLWHAGRVAVAERRHFRCVYDLAERVLPEAGAEGTAAAGGAAARQTEVEDHWLMVALSGCGVASERHIQGYHTTPMLKAADRRRILERNLRRKRIVRCEVEGVRGPCYATPQTLAELAAPADRPEPVGTTLISPFDSLLWQRERARELLDFDYRIEIYTPAPKRRFGYYVLPILHGGRLVGRLDPKLHRDEQRLEVKRIDLEPGFEPAGDFRTGLGDALADLGAFVGARRIDLPGPWKRRISL